ncbi:hypothetical protein T4A_997 [Trichinella pseudospiralis]|uniref:Uncharacterized protein n=1 Tax=Trichinella pseudospiralis TaxID=6337 RepID=A0A0V1ECS0_TRIPS|nr:hypothetical protein T4A_997 [Trichinella pseudospiralis]
MGDVLQFETFWEHFEDQIHRQSELRDTTRFSYLRSCLTGNALNAIDGLTVTAANYSAAIEVLKSRFSRRDLIIQSHIRKLLCVMSCNDQPLETSRKFYDEVVLHIRALEALGENPSLPELIASEPLFMQRLDHMKMRGVWRTSSSKSLLPGFSREYVGLLEYNKGNRCFEAKRCDYPSYQKMHYKLLHSD